MKVFLAIVLGIGIGQSSFAASLPADDAKKLASLATVQISQDFRIVFHEEKDARICGGQGDAYVGQVQMNVYSRGYKQGMSKISDRWINVDRRYSIFKRELSEPNAKLFDSEHQCME